MLLRHGTFLVKVWRDRGHHQPGTTLKPIKSGAHILSTTPVDHDDDECLIAPLKLQEMSVYGEC